MNIHEHQAKNILKKYGASVPNGVYGFSVSEIVEKVKNLKTKRYVLKAQIHQVGKAGGIKIVNSIDELKAASEKLLGTKLITAQTGSGGKEVKRIYVGIFRYIKRVLSFLCCR